MSETSSRHRRDEVESNGAPSMIRTCDLLVRSQTLYPAELWARQTLKLSTGISWLKTDGELSLEGELFLDQQA